MAKDGLARQGRVEQRGRDLIKIVADTRKKKRAGKYKDILDWVESHCCYKKENNPYIWNMWRALDNEAYLYHKINTQIFNKNLNITGALNVLEYNLKVQHGLLNGNGKAAVKGDLLATFGVDEADIGTVIDQATIVNESSQAYEKCPPTKDQNVVFLLSFLKMLAFQAGRDLATLLNTRIGTSKILLRWSTGWAGFPLTGAKVNSRGHIMTLQGSRRLNVDQLNRKFQGSGARGFMQHCQTLFQHSPKGPRNDIRYLCLELPAGPYTWHQVQAGLTAKGNVVNYLSPHYVQLCPFGKAA